MTLTRRVCGDAHEMKSVKQEPMIVPTYHKTLQNWPNARPAFLIYFLAIGQSNAAKVLWRRSKVHLPPV
jgi:hypothetical protein